MRLYTLALVAVVLAAPVGLAAACSSAPAATPAPDAGLALADGARPDTTPAPLPTALASGLDDPRGIAIVGDNVYVAEHGAGRVVSIPRKGGPLVVLAKDRKGPLYMATDGQVLIVTEREAGDVVRLTTAGALDVLASLEAPTDVAVRDGAAWVLATGVDGGLGAVWRIALGGAAPQAIVAAVDRPIALDVGAASVYFTARKVQGAAGNVFAASRDLDAGDDVQTVIATTDNARGVEVDEAAGLVYWGVTKATGAGAGHGWVDRTEFDGAATTTIAIAPTGCVDRLRRSGGFVYFATCVTLVRVAVDAGAAQDLVTNTTVGDFAVDGNTVYWTDMGAGRVYAAPLGP